MVYLDKVLFSSLHEAYKNYDTVSTPINIPAASILNGATVNYTGSIAYVRGGTRADTYLDGNSVKILANASTSLITGGPYQFTDFETASTLIDYYDNSVDVTISIFNGTGGTINLIAQTITVIMVRYDAPITPI